jgi:hypothetical protein
VNAKVRQCENCNFWIAVKGERFCKGCKKEVIRKLKDDGYLTEPDLRGTFSERIGRKERSSAVLGGSCEMRTDDE